MRLAEFLCYNLALAFLGPLKSLGSRTPSITRFNSNEKYFAQRVADTSHYRKLFEPFVKFEGKTVLDLGCNLGYLLHSFLQHEKFTAIGGDLITHYLKEAQRNYGNEIEFVQTTPTQIPLPDNSVDVVYTIDTVEHLSQPREIFQDVFRVLKPGGIFLVHFNPWLNPHGHHLEDIIAFPWPHAVFSMNTLLNVAEKLYESPGNPTSCYYLDEKGQKKPNPYADHEKWNNYLNSMTIRRFNHMLKELPFEVSHQARIGFGGSTFKLSRLTRGLAKLPVLTEYFTSILFTVLVKPEA
jgi:ubiquinone/menaquinone biosynthesis C-methylase UbiE